MADHQLGTLVDGYQRAHGLSDSDIASRLGMTDDQLCTWRTTDACALPNRRSLDLIAALLGRSYHEVLDAALQECGYADELQPSQARDRLSDNAASACGRRTSALSSKKRQRVDGVDRHVRWVLARYTSI